MCKLFSVNDVSEFMNKSKTTIYKYLKSGQLKGYKVDGVWKVEYDETESDEEISEQEVISDAANSSKYIYERSLEKKLTKYDNIMREISNHFSNELKITERFNKLMHITNEESEPLNDILQNNHMYKSIKSKKERVKSELDELYDSYKELNHIIKGINVKHICYSRTTESVYVEADIDVLANLLNRLSQLNKRFFIMSNNIIYNQTLKIRFSNHIPDYYTNESLEILRKSKEVDIIVPYKELEQKINVTPKSQSIDDKIYIKQLTDKLNVAKMYSQKPIRKLTRSELEEYYELSVELRSNDRTKNEGFVNSLESKQAAILKALDKM